MFLIGSKNTVIGARHNMHIYTCRSRDGTVQKKQTIQSIANTNLNIVLLKDNISEGFMVETTPMPTSKSHDMALSPGCKF